jgi:hypothetical protein
MESPDLSVSYKRRAAERPMAAMMRLLPPLRAPCDDAHA